MLSEKQIREIREHLQKAQNPVFLFDNDVDGLASFLLLRRYCGKGKGVAIKSFPELDISYFRKVQELKADYIFVLDKPEISGVFLQEAEKNNYPLVWIDHHKINLKEEYKKQNIYYYNPVFLKSESNEPTTYLCYKVVNKEDLWIAMLGCVGDSFLPEFAKEFLKKYPDLYKKNVKTAFEVLYTTEIGKIIKMLGFGLKDRTSNVVKMLKYLVDLKSPYNLLKEDNKNRSIYVRFNYVDKKYSKLVERAKEVGKKHGKLLFFQYGGDLSLSADISNELCYLFPEKIVVVAYIKGIKANISLRGKLNMIELTRKSIQGIENATGGGHEHATGAQMPVECLPIFKENLLKELNEK